MSHENSCIFDDLARRAFHPQFCIPAVGELETPRQRLRIFPLWRSVDKDRLEVERSQLRIVIGADLHGEEAIG